MEKILAKRSGYLPSGWGRPDLEWLHYHLITKGRVVIVRMVQAAIGWNFGEVTIQGAKEWVDMSPEAIWAFMEDAQYNATVVEDSVLAAKIEALGAKVVDC
jgi:hypothetical protein